MSPDATMKGNFEKKSQPVPIEYFNLGFYIVTPLLLGVGAGIWLDNRFNSKPFYLISGLLLGISSVFYMLVKMIKSSKN